MICVTVQKQVLSWVETKLFSKPHLNAAHMHLLSLETSSDSTMSATLIIYDLSAVEACLLSSLLSVLFVGSLYIWALCKYDVSDRNNSLVLFHLHFVYASSAYIWVTNTFCNIPYYRSSNNALSPWSSSVSFPQSLSHFTVPYSSRMVKSYPIPFTFGYHTSFGNPLESISIHSIYRYFIHSF